MEETRSQDSEPVRHQTVSVTDQVEEVRECHAGRHSARELVAGHRNVDGRPPSGSSQLQMIADATHRGHRPVTSNRSPPISSTAHSDEVSARSGTPEEQSERLRPSGTAGERATNGGEDVITRRETAGSLYGLRTTKSPSDGLLNPKCGPLAINSTSKEPMRSIHGPLISNFQSEGPVNTRATKSPPSPAPTSRVTAFSVADILDPGKFGCERRQRVDPRSNEPRLTPAAGPHHELWSPWMQRLELQLRAGSAGINNINFLRGIGQ